MPGTREFNSHISETVGRRFPYLLHGHSLALFVGGNSVRGQCYRARNVPCEFRHDCSHPGGLTRICLFYSEKHHGATGF